LPNIIEAKININSFLQKTMVFLGKNGGLNKWIEGFGEGGFMGVSFDVKFLKNNYEKMKSYEIKKHNYVSVFIALLSILRSTKFT
jgi:hypothetical protein